MTVKSERGLPDIVNIKIITKGYSMYYVGIDVAKDKHDCCIIDDVGNVILKPFRIKNSLEGFCELIQRISIITSNRDEVIIGLEDTGHYSGNLVNYFTNLFTVKTINPIFTAKYKKASTLRRTKTDKIDTVQIARMLRSGKNFRPVVSIPYDHEELKSLSRYRLVLVKKRAIEKNSIKRLINILVPEWEQYFRDVHRPTSYAALFAYPGKNYLSTCRTPALTQILRSASKGYYGEDLATRLRDTAKNSIGRISGAKSYELRQTIKHIRNLSDEIDEVDDKIKEILDRAHSPICTIPGIGTTLAATIIGEVGDFSKFSSPEKILAFAGMVPTVYSSGKYVSSHNKMDKRGSRNLRCALFLAVRSASLFVPELNEYLLKKRKEGKHFFVACSHAAKKLVRLMYSLETEHRSYEPKSVH